MYGGKNVIDGQIKALAEIIKNDDLREYTGDAFWNLVQAVISQDPMSGALAAKDVKQIIFHMPTVIFWNKMKRYFCGTFSDYSNK